MPKIVYLEGATKAQDERIQTLSRAVRGVGYSLHDVRWLDSDHKFGDSVVEFRVKNKRGVKGVFFYHIDKNGEVGEGTYKNKEW